MKCWETSGALGKLSGFSYQLKIDLSVLRMRTFASPNSREPLKGVEGADASTWVKLPLTKVAGKPIANFLGSPYCQRGDTSPSIQTESRPAGLVMAVTDF